VVNGLNLCPCTSWRLNPKERFIDDILDAYEKAYPNLSVHSHGYPAPADLRSKVKWGRFDNNGTYTGAVTLDAAEGPTTTFRIPADARAGDTIHIIAEASDDRTLSLTRYARTVVTVK